MSNPKHVCLSLTEAEAAAMWHALGNSVDHQDVMESMFPDSASRLAAYRASRKLRAALAATRGARRKA